MGEDASGSTGARDRGQPLARSTVNIWGAALKAFSKSRGMELALPYMKVSKDPMHLKRRRGFPPYSIYHKPEALHDAELAVLLYAQAGDLINLHDGVIDMKAMTLRIRDGKVREVCHTAHTAKLYADF
jgi:hypothetical protein